MNAGPPPSHQGGRGDAAAPPGSPEGEADALFQGPYGAAVITFEH